MGQQGNARKVIVTGGAGFIGSHLTERLLRDGCTVIVIDDLSVGRRRNLAHLAGNDKLTFVEADVSKLEADSPLFAGVDWVFHMAARADIVPSIQEPVQYHRANVDGTVAVLEASRAAGVKRFIYAASSSCYGLATTFPTPETAPIQPQYPYALTKWLGEQCVQHWNHVYGLETVSLRMFNVYGPRARTSGTYGAVFGVFLAQKIAGKPYTVVGDGEQTRDFTYVTDVVDAFVRAAESNLSGAIMNIGSGGTYSINRLVQLLGGDVVHVPKRPGEPDCTYADTQLIQDRLGWEPSTSFEEGVAAMLEHLDDWRDAPVWEPASIEVATKDWFELLGNEEKEEGHPNA